MFFKYILHIIRKPQRAESKQQSYSVLIILEKLIYRNKIMGLQCHKEEKKLKVAQKYQKHMLFTKNILQKPSHLHELAFAHPY